MPCGWEGNRRSYITLFQWFFLIIFHSELYPLRFVSGELNEYVMLCYVMLWLVHIHTQSLNEGDEPSGLQLSRGMAL